MYDLPNRFIEEVAQATDNNDHTFAVQMIAGLAGEQFIETKIADIRRRHRKQGSLTQADIAERDEYRTFLLNILSDEIGNIDQLRAAF